jgi:Hydrazine synthase alpha subunit middle domain/F5/8 type C domain
MRVTPLLGSAVALFLTCLTPAFAAEKPVRSDSPNAITFDAREAKFVRFVVLATDTGGQPCIDELEVYGTDAKDNLALEKKGARASASSCLSGYAAHAIEHLNDGEYGNDKSWIAAGVADEWAQIELPKPATVSRVVFSRDRKRHFSDRMPVHFEVRLSMDGEHWKTVKQVKTGSVPVALRVHGPSGFTGIVPGPPPPPRVGPEPVVEVVQAVHVAEKDQHGFPNLARNPKAVPAASSLISGHAIHQIAHLNDGLVGNDHSWISAKDPSWAEIDLGGVYWVYKVAFGSDSSGGRPDRAAAAFSIYTATEYAKETKPDTWSRVYSHRDAQPVHTRTEFTFKPVQARWVRVSVDTTSGGAVRIDEMEVFGQEKPIPLDATGPLGDPGTGPLPPSAAPVDDAQLRLAFLGEEHAWLKTYGRADLSPRLVPYNGRVKEYPHHVGDDRLPLPRLASAPSLDGVCDDACWEGASRGVARVAFPRDFDKGALANHAVTAGWHAGYLYLHLEFNQLLSRHLAVISTADGQGCGVLVHKDDGLYFEQYAPEGRRAKLDTSTPVEGAFDDALTRWEVRLPLSLFPECRELGLRVGLGMGGKHTNSLGRTVTFVFTDMAIAQAGSCVDGVFKVRIGAQGKASVTVRGNVPGLENGATLAGGQSTVLTIDDTDGAIGPEYTLELTDGNDEEYTLHLFRYDPAKRTLDLMDDMVVRFAAKGLDVRPERQAFNALQKNHAKLMAKKEPDHAAERDAFFEARMAKRALLMREPDLEPAKSILFVKRRPFEPSHNYSVNLDSRYRPGGSIARVSIPRKDGRFRPEAATVEHLFESGGGIARTPAANFALDKIYFAYRPEKDGYYHIMAMNTDGSGLRQLTDGPFHDYWPCPLPDGDLAVISTRCRMRFLCWRPQAFVLFRMDPEGQDFQPLSFANLSEWAPSVMSDGRLIWTRSEYQDKGADFGHTLWAIRPDGTKPELVFGNDIIQPNGYANGREVPGTNEFACTLISHFGDLNGPIALVDTDQGRFNPEAITSLTPEVPWPGMWPMEECFRDPVPLARDYFLCSHAPQNRFGIFVIDRYGNRELLYADRDISSMCPTPYRVQTPPPVLARSVEADPDEEFGEFVIRDVHAGISPPVEHGAVKYIRVVEEVRAHLETMPDGKDRDDHPAFQDWYATPVHKVSGPYGWTTYVAKAPHGLVPVEKDGSAHFKAPAGKVLYFQALDKDLNELQRMRSVVQLQPGEKRSCIGCHEHRRQGPANSTRLIAQGPVEPQLAAWEGVPFSYEKVVQPVLDANCVECHDQNHKMGFDLRGDLDREKVPASYRTLVSKGLVHYADMGYNSGGCEKAGPLSLGTLRSKLWEVLDAGHHKVELDRDEMHRIKAWIDLNCPLWPDYINRMERPGPDDKIAKAK